MRHSGIKNSKMCPKNAPQSHVIILNIELECYEVQKTSNMCYLLVLNVTRVALKTLEGAAKMMDKYTGTRSEHYGEIKTFLT